MSQPILPIEVSIQELLHQAKQLGLVWGFRKAEVISTTAPYNRLDCLARYDGDLNGIPMQSTIGPMFVGQNVSVLYVPPSGNYIIGNLGPTKIPFTPTISGTGFVAGPGYLRGDVTYNQYEVDVEIEYQWLTGANQGSSGWTFGGMPKALGGSLVNTTVRGGWWYVRPTSTARAQGSILMSSGGSTLVCQVGGDGTSPVAFSQIGVNLPEAWANGAILTLRATYPIDPNG